LYRGSFKPPHQQHEEGLCHAYFYTGFDLNVVAAIFALLDDRNVEAKMHMKKKEGLASHVFTKEQRISLWNQAIIYGG